MTPKEATMPPGLEPQLAQEARDAMHVVSVPWPPAQRAQGLFSKLLKKIYVEGREAEAAAD